MGSIWRLAKTTVYEFVDDDCATMAAALSYYTVFSLPPLLALVILLASVFLDPGDFQGRLSQQISGLIGSEGSQQIQTMIRNADQSSGKGPLVGILGLVALVFGATGAFVQLQAALNQAWEVKPDPESGGIRAFLMKRVLSFGMILALAFILIVSLVVSAVVTAFGDALGRYLPEGISSAVLQAVNIGVSLLVLTLLFGAIFRFLPDAVISWRHVWAGAFFTALMFTIGKYLIGLYLGNSDPVSAYGAAASLAIIFVWVYYSSMMLLLGAEFTQVWARRSGDEIQPEPHAIRVPRTAS